MQTRSARAEIISVGDELLNGEIIDTNKTFLAGNLKALGIPCAYFQTIGDELDDISAAFTLARGRSKVIIATGGLGPTEDDRTVEGLAHSLDLKLTFREEVMEDMAMRLQRPKEAFSQSSRKQAWLPEGAVALKNDWGTAPGMHVKTGDGALFFLLPGVPREMQGLFESRITPILAEQIRDRETLVTKFIHIYGIPESQVGDRIQHLMLAGQNPEVGTRVSSGIVTVRLVATGPCLADATRLLEPAADAVRQALREGIFGEDEETLASAAGKALLENGLTIALAESCTAGLVSAALGGVSGISSALIEAAVVYANEAKIRTCGVRPETLDAYGAVSPETARELAQGIRARNGTDIGLSVTGIAGPTGGTPEKPVGLVQFGVASARGVQTVERRFWGHPRDMVRERATHAALDLIRREARALRA